MTAPEPVFPDGVLAPFAPLSPAMTWNGLVFTSGQIPRGTEGEILGETVTEQTHGVLERLRLVLEAAGTDLKHVIRTTVYLTSIDDFADMNAAYKEVFGDHAPTRTSVEVSALAFPEYLVEIDAIAVTPSD
ncbi:RidA family protein [uncultured Demequina sp.]|uniref:RidA family protein n=1 Tax=uncultured Demequina sp. TaxID=693499 RepID=UPI0025F353F7|nr:RidA family protein [uncultured Demequina sp.]